LTLKTLLIENGKSVHALGRSCMSKQNRFYVEVKDIKLHFLQYGASGPQVLLIPGIIGPAITWGFVCERLARNTRITIIDNRGRGLSTADYAEDAAGVVEELGLFPPSCLVTRWACGSLRGSPRSDLTSCIAVSSPTRQ
jgi:hypothetical protein